MGDTMNSTLRSVLVWIFCAGMVMLGSMQHEELVRAAPPERRFSDLQVTLQVQQRRVLQLEPITLRVSVTNPTSAPMLGLGTTYCSLCRGNGLEIIVVTPDGTRKRYPELWGRRITSIPRGKPHILEPRQYTITKVRLKFMLDEIFPQPGTYQVIAVLNEVDGEGRLESPPVPVQVIEPEGLDRLAFQAIRDFEAETQEYFWGGRTLDTSQDFVLRHGDTRYGAYVSQDLGKYFLSQKDYDQAIEYLTVASRGKDFLDGEAVLEKLIEAHWKKGNKTKIPDIEQELRRRYPDSPYFDSEE